uniref:Uncharacterized protein n=1 Tax=Arundo donax TaxID=35708 RepID=A0A0A9BAE8_ARUDO
MNTKIHEIKIIHLREISLLSKKRVISVVPAPFIRSLDRTSAQRPPLDRMSQRHLRSAGLSAHPPRLYASRAYLQLSLTFFCPFICFV